MDAPETVTDATRLLADEGYGASIVMRDGLLHFGDLPHSCPIENAVAEQMFRFEGPSDPGDEMVVFAVRDTVSGAKGTLASDFGLAAEPEVFEALKYLASTVQPS